MTTLTETSYAGLPAHNADRTVPNGHYCLTGTSAAGREWRRVFRSTRRLQAAAAREFRAYNDLPEQERSATARPSAWRAIGSGADGYTEAVRI